jgi:hypothetical protein
MPLRAGLPEFWELQSTKFTVGTIDGDRMAEV